MIIEGKNPCYEALVSDLTIEKILFSKQAPSDYVNKLKPLIKQKNCKFQFVDKNVLDSFSKTKRHQGVICFASEYKYTDFEDLLKRDGLILLLDKIEDPQNFASIIRSAECAKINGIVITKNHSALVTDSVIKTSTGAIFHTDIAKVTNLNDCIDKLKDNGYFIYALDMDGENIYKSNIKGNIALLVGSEGFGVTKSYKKNCDGVVSIPMKGKVNSLNVSNATAIAVFEYNRQNFED
ncbi:MAG: 23S rRNA (guanosine(2251)-2'-O)-methyltransferase RlmB [Clostridia bacterium]|nr:23S rRNA (guanosine(2251)-2'-O)-methyltransferase RlmB [Clostridia bacterium]